jgi:hypothetical protein
MRLSALVFASHRDSERDQRRHAAGNDDDSILTARRQPTL